MSTVEERTVFKVGDWVFCEFELQLIRDMEDGRVREVTDGACNHSGYDLTDRCMPLTYEMKQIADSFKWTADRIHREGVTGLNYPDIHRWLVNHWTETCRHLGDNNALAADFKALREFENTVLDKQVVQSGFGFPLMRQR